MWCERILRNAGDEPGKDPDDRHVDFVDITWEQCKPLLKAKTRGGESIQLLLPQGHTPRQGDVLFEDAARVVVINILPCEVIVARPASTSALARLALELGNLHLPTQVDSKGLSFIEDESAMRVLEKLQIPWAKSACRFEPTTLIAGPNPNVNGKLQIIRRPRPAAAHPPVEISSFL